MKYLAFALVLVMATSAFGLEKKAYQMRDDFGTEPMYDGALQYYYYIPCPTYSWFWAWTGWEYCDWIGVLFQVGDQGTGGWDPIDPMNCMVLETVRILDFAGYGTVYPGLFTIDIVVGCPPWPYVILYDSPPLETHFGWNYIDIIPPVSLCPCFGGYFLKYIVWIHFKGTDCTYPAIGMDNISTALEQTCEMHDLGCLPAVWPRDETMIHSGYYGNGSPDVYNPPLRFCDGRDTTPDCTMYGMIDLAWRSYITCSGPTATETSTWGNIKSMYR
jgi:hypothetical protein